MYVQYNIYICSLDISKPFEFLWFPFFQDSLPWDLQHWGLSRQDWQNLSLETLQQQPDGSWGFGLLESLLKSLGSGVSRFFLHVVYDAIKRFAKKNLSQNITQYDQFAYISSHFGGFYPIFRRQRCMKPSMLQRHSKGTIPSYYPKRTN